MTGCQTSGGRLAGTDRSSSGDLESQDSRSPYAKTPEPSFRGLMRMTGLEPARLAAQEPKFHRYPSTDYQSAHFMGIPFPWLPLIITNYYPR